MGKLFRRRAASLSYESNGCIFYNQKNLESIQVQMFIFLFLRGSHRPHRTVQWSPIFHPWYRTYNHHHHHVMPFARISMTLSRYFSLSFIASGRSSGLHPISSHSCCMYVRGGRPAFARPYTGVHRSTSLMSSSLLLQQYPACLVRLTWIVFVMGGRWP